MPRSRPDLPRAEVDGRDVIRVVADMVGLVEPRLLALWRVTGPTPSQRRVLSPLLDGSRSAGDIADSLGIVPSSLTRQLAKLEGRGLIVRKVDTADRRRVVAKLTSRARRALLDHPVFAGTGLARAIRELTPAQRRRLIDSLEMLVHIARSFETPHPNS